MILAVDIDDVLADYVGAFLSFMETKDFHLKAGQITRSLAEMGIAEGPFFKEFEEGGHLLTLPTIPGSQKAIERLSECFEIRAITSRSADRMGHTSEWLFERFPEIAGVYFSRAKGELCKEWQAVGLIEDQIRYAEQYSPAYVLAQPWNQEWSGIRGDWETLLEYILK